MSETPAKNDCVFCDNETGGDGTHLFCKYYKEEIKNPYTVGEKGAFRQQTSCQGFRFKPYMVTPWKEKFEKKR